MDSEAQYRCVMGFYLVLEKNKIRKFVGERMKLENIILSVVIQVEKDKYFMCFFVCRFQFVIVRLCNQVEKLWKNIRKLEGVYEIGKEVFKGEGWREDNRIKREGWRDIRVQQRRWGGGEGREEYRFCRAVNQSDIMRN